MSDVQIFKYSCLTCDKRGNEKGKEFHTQKRCMKCFAKQSYQKYKDYHDAYHQIEEHVKANRARQRDYYYRRKAQKESGPIMTSSEIMTSS